MIYHVCTKIASSKVHFIWIWHGKLNYWLFIANIQINRLSYPWYGTVHFFWRRKYDTFISLCLLNKDERQTDWLCNMWAFLSLSSWCSQIAINNCCHGFKHWCLFLSMVYRLFIVDMKNFNYCHFHWWYESYCVLWSV